MVGRIGRRGIYEIILTFFLIATLVFAVIMFLYVNTGSSLLYAGLKQQGEAPRDASLLKDALLACHRLDYLSAELLAEQIAGTAQCPAMKMLRGFRITQLPMNNCTETGWMHQNGEYGQAVPFIVSVEQSSGQRCLARLEVFLAPEGR